MSWPEAFVAAVGILAVLAFFPLPVLALARLERGRK
jgi:hypothetical protein